MNIIVKPHGSDLCHCRPDTTWERENKDFYAPDSITGLSFSPVLFARICRSGKCVGKKFASRYYDAIGFGSLLYISDYFTDDRCASSCADHTSILPSPLYNTLTLQGDDNMFTLSKDGKTIFETNCLEATDGCGSQGAVQAIESAIVHASELISLRTGDFIAVELAPVELIASRQDTEVRLNGRFCENDLFNLKIIF